MNLKLLILLLLAPVLSFSQKLKTIVSEEFNSDGKALQNQYTIYATPIPVLSDTSIKNIIANEDSMLSFVFNYYQPDLQKTQNEVDADLKITKEDGYLKINYSREGFSYFSRNISLPNGFIKGDLNRDHLNDILVTVWATGGTHAIWVDAFLFLGTKGGYQFYKKYDSYTIGSAKSYYAKFYPSRIKDGYLIGKMSMLAKNDPGCCPSLFYRTTLKFNNGKFKIVSEKKCNEANNF